MSRRPAMGLARRVDPAGVMSSYPDLPRSDRVVAYRLPAPDAQRTPAVDWARGVFEGAPRPVRWLLVIGFRHVLRLRLRRVGTPGTVLGWPVTDEHPHAATLTAGSPLIDGANVALVEPGEVVWVTLVRYRRPIGWLVWRAAEVLHVVLTPRLLARAADAHALRLSAT